MDKQPGKRARRKRSGEKTIKFRCDYSSTPLRVLESRGWTRVSDTSWDLWWCDCSEVKLALHNLQRLRAQQRVAHFLNHGELTRKNLLYRNLRRYKRLLLKAGKSREAALCDIMPVSFELPSEYRMLVEEYRRCQGATWIVKPAAGSQGRGIFLFRRLRDLAEWRSREYPAPSADSNSDGEGLAAPDVYIVQKYIDEPYLLAGCKFDLRIYVLVTSFQPLKVWLAREGFARLSGEQFSLARIDDSRVHLTNMAIQLKAADGRPARRPARPSADRDCERTAPPARLGSKWPLSCLRQYLTERHGPAVVDDLLHNIAGMIMASLAAVQRSVVACQNSFELYGYDVLLDKALRPWLLEVNASPSLNATDAHDFRLKFDLVDDVLNVLDLERKLTGRETRVGGFDLLWDDAPVYCPVQPDKLNVFLGACNDRLDQLQALNSQLQACSRSPLD
ncbi:probable tubulin polyglutamylase TTLL9 [Phymastichus coffea]|uniref:probable tubulin polyglutamylase TTLL9 n=1 Tax=Phymastichus coffea TaxID=108790 RepID=UPI00273B03E4|nr:probable tubulin polyglutamylase TTLL9 [Phymastichus coffea]